MYFLQQPDTHSFRLYHDFEETRVGVDRYLNIVRPGSEASDPSAVILDTGTELEVEILRGAEITARDIDIGEPVTDETELVVIWFEPVPAGGSRLLRITETYTDPGRYIPLGDEFLWDRSFRSLTQYRRAAGRLVPDGQCRTGRCAHAGRWPCGTRIQQRPAGQHRRTHSRAATLAQAAGPIRKTTGRDNMKRSATLTVLLTIVSLAVLSAPSLAQEEDTARKGPYERLAIVNAMIIPGHGGPAYGPADILIEGDRIDQIIAHNGVLGRSANTPLPDADRVIDATGMYVMPGLIDLHTHIRTEPLPLQYVYNMKLAHGVTTMVNGAGTRLGGRSRAATAVERKPDQRTADVPDS